MPFVMSKVSLKGINSEELLQELGKEDISTEKLWTSKDCYDLYAESDAITARFSPHSVTFNDKSDERTKVDEKLLNIVERRYRRNSLWACLPFLIGITPAVAYSYVYNSFIRPDTPKLLQSDIYFAYTFLALLSLTAIPVFRFARHFKYKGNHTRYKYE